MITNSRSFTCLLKEIDEQEEQNIVGSHLQGVKVTRQAASNLDQVTEEEPKRIDQS